MSRPGEPPRVPVSVAISTLNRPRQLARCLDALAKPEDWVVDEFARRLDELSHAPVRATALCRARSWPDALSIPHSSRPVTVSRVT